MAAAQPRAGRELVRVLGLIFALAAVVGGAVGQGILRAPGIVAEAVPYPVLILLLWLAGAAIAAVNAVPYAELGCAVPQAGGPYVFVRRAFGPTAGVIVGWSDWFNNIASQAFMSVVVAEFVHRLGWATTVPVSVLAPPVIGVFFALNWTNTRLCGSSQTLGSIVKGGALLALVLILLFAPSHQAVVATAAEPTPIAMGFGAIVIALRAVQNTYDGWNNGIYFCEEMHAPERHIPRALFGGIAWSACSTCWSTLRCFTSSVRRRWRIPPSLPRMHWVWCWAVGQHRADAVRHHFRRGDPKPHRHVRPPHCVGHGARPSASKRACNSGAGRLSPARPPRNHGGRRRARLVRHL